METIIEEGNENDTLMEQGSVYMINKQKKKNLCLKDWNVFIFYLDSKSSLFPLTLDSANH